MSRAIERFVGSLDLGLWTRIGAMNRPRSADFSPQDRAVAERDGRPQARCVVPGSCGLKPAPRFMESSLFLSDLLTGVEQVGCRPRLGRSAAFSLPELCVVTALAGLLVATGLLPAVNHGLEQSRQVHCRNNLRHWARAMIEYAEDHEGYLPREGYRRDGRTRSDNWARVWDPSNSNVWYNALPPYLNEPPARAYASLLTGARPLFYENKLFHCPSAQFREGVGSDNYAYFSLAMNSKLILAPTQPPHFSILYATIQRPADTVAFLDGRVHPAEPKVDVLQLDSDLGAPSVSASRFAPRHDQGGNLAFCDGHAEWQPGTNVVETRPGRNRGFAIFPDGEMIWTADPFVDPNGPD